VKSLVSPTTYQGAGKRLCGVKRVGVKKGGHFIGIIHDSRLPEMEKKTLPLYPLSRRKN